MKKIEGIYNEIHELNVNYGKLDWILYTSGYDFGVEEAYKKIIDYLKDKEKYQYILKVMKEDNNDIDKRKLEIIYNVFKPYHLSEELNKLSIQIQNKENELSKILNSFRYTFLGKEVSSVELDQILTIDEDRERRKAAYFAKSQINKPLVDGGFIELINLRKEYAKKYGANNFVTLKLEENELDKDIFDNWLKDLHAILPKMKDKRKKYANYYLDDDKIMPWDEGYIRSKLAPSLNKQVDMSEYYNYIREFFNLFGIDISKFNITYDIFPRSNKSEWGYNFPIETAKDSRILANVKNKFFEYAVLLHETGHAVHSFILDPNEKILNEGVSGIISEGIANLFNSFLYHKTFYQNFFTDVDKVENEFSKLREFQKLNSLRAINNIFFDHKLYLNEIKTLDDINNLYRDNYKEVLNEEPFKEEAPWAFRIHHTTHPIYLHNYFMGDVTCEMLSKVFKEKYGDKVIDKPKEFGAFLIEEVIKPSGLYKFNDLFKRISGENFSLKYMID